MSLKLRDSYDWIVLGDGVGALLSAALAARQGLSALVLPLFRAESLFRTSSGQVFEPETNSILGVPGVDSIRRQQGLLSLCLDRLNLSEQEWEIFQPGAAAPQILTPGMRVRLTRDPEVQSFELRRELFPEELRGSWSSSFFRKTEEALSDFWSTYPEWLETTAEEKVSKKPVPPLPRTFSVEASQTISRIFSGRVELAPVGSEQLAEFFSGIRSAVSGIECDDAMPLFAPEMETLFSLFELGRQACRIRGGQLALRKMLQGVAKRQGVHVLNSSECRRIFIEEGRFVGVQAAHVGSMIRAKAGAVEIPLERLSDRIQFSGSQKAQLVPAVAGWRFSLAMTVPEEAIPPGASLRSVWKEKGAPGIEVEVAEPYEYSLAEPRSRLVFLRTTLSYHESTLDPHFLRMTAARMARQVTEIFPFLEQYWESGGPSARMYPDFRYDLNQYGMPAVPRTLEDIPYSWLRFAERGLGCRAGIDGLFLVSPESYPMLGTLGPVVAALESVTWLAQQSGHPGPFSVSLPHA